MLYCQCMDPKEKRPGNPLRDWFGGEYTVIRSKKKLTELQAQHASHELFKREDIGTFDKWRKTQI